MCFVLLPRNVVLGTKSKATLKDRNFLGINQDVHGRVGLGKASPTRLYWKCRGIQISLSPNTFDPDLRCYLAKKMFDLRLDARAKPQKGRQITKPNSLRIPTSCKLSFCAEKILKKMNFRLR